MEEFVNLTLAQIVTQNYKAAEVFEKYGLDFCCKGKKKLADACQDHALNLTEILSALNSLYLTSTDVISRFSTWDLTFLIDYIVQNHHSYVKNATERLLFYTQKVASVHGSRHPELLEIADLFEGVGEEFDLHMRKEEFMLFPYIKKIEAAAKFDSPFEDSIFGSVVSPISRMEEEHESVAQIFSKIRSLTTNYSAPADACNTYKVCFSELAEFEKDLHQHVHLENNILFPKAVKMENQVREEMVK